MPASQTARSYLSEAALALEEKSASELVALDVSDHLAFTDIFLICSGRNERMVRSIADSAERRLQTCGATRFRREGQTTGRWILLDFGELVIHVFHPEERGFYQLERLWRDCPEISISQTSEAATFSDQTEML